MISLHFIHFSTHTHTHTNTDSRTHLHTAGVHLCVCVCVRKCSVKKKNAVHSFISLSAIKYSSGGKQLKWDPPRALRRTTRGETWRERSSVCWMNRRMLPVRPEIKLDERWKAPTKEGTTKAEVRRIAPPNSPPGPDRSASLEAKEINHDSNDRREI